MFDLFWGAGVAPMFVGIIIIVIFLIIFFRFFPLGLWITALFSGVRISIITLLTMRLRRVNPSLIVLNQIKLWKAGLKINSNELEAHYLAGGNPTAVADALIAADKASLDLSFERAAAIDLAGRDLVDAIRTSVSPRVIATPLIAAVAKDGIQVKATARVTVRTNINRLVGGAGEETIIARVGEGIVTTIGSAATHKEVLENPDRISQVVSAKGLDSGTAFEILSIDIADVDVGSNIGAVLQIDQAEADKKIAQAKAEERRVMAIAREQEMKAQVEEMKAKVVEAESQLPLAIADALKKGNIGVLDYYNMKNVMADTEMRYSISGMDTTSKNSK
ncbi:flotillin-like protein FloA [Brachyspira pilosicoli]|uniref:flotillin-like protein FloA n=1 Tax=Brachyspira pilosicoli TaxID=52584 RepID=UPI002543B6A1|nr:flotillin-like protein FloA [Brachyspira pilosicoli]WIH85831.1 flotillin-like protein FloA [Brachyspira pilosicoli]